MKQHVTLSSIDEMKKHSKENHVQLIAYKNVIYDVTDFQFSHPGGQEAIAQFLNTNVDNVLFNPEFHKHSSQIILKLQQMRYGQIIKKHSTDAADDIQFSRKVGQTRKFLSQNAEREPSSLKHIASSPTRDLFQNQTHSYIRGSSIDQDPETDDKSNLIVPIFEGKLQTFHTKIWKH